MVGEDSSERRDSLLTTAYRGYLRDRPEPDQNQRQTRYRMRSRVADGLADFLTLNQNIRKRDLRQIFSKAIDEPVLIEHKKYGNLSDPLDPDYDESAGAYVAVSQMVAFGYRGLREIGADPEKVITNAIARGIWEGEALKEGIDRSQLSIECDFEIDVGARREVDRPVPDVPIYVNSEEIDCNFNRKEHQGLKMSPLQKWKQDLPLSKSERARLQEQLVEVVPNKEYQQATPSDFNDLVAEYLVNKE